MVRTLLSKIRIRRVLPVLALAPVILALAEFSARRLLPPHFPDVLESAPYRRLTFNAGPRGISTPAHFTANRWGMRGDEPPVRFAAWNTVIALGSSTTLCYSLDDHKTWSAFLEARLQARLRTAPAGRASAAGKERDSTNASTPGQNRDGKSAPTAVETSASKLASAAGQGGFPADPSHSFSVTTLDRPPAAGQTGPAGLGPDTWVGNAGQDGITSAACAALADTVIADLHPRVLLILLGQTDLVLDFSDERRMHGSPYDQAFQRRAAAVAPRHAGWREGFRLCEAYSLWQRRRHSKALVLNQSAHQSFYPPPLDTAEDVLPPDSVLLISLPAFRDRIEQMGRHARAAGVRAVFLTQPALYGNDSAWFRRFARRIACEGKAYRISAATQARLLGRYNAELLRLCAARHFEALDLAAAIPHDSTYFYDEAHFTEAGAALAAQKIAGYLLAPPR